MHRSRICYAIPLSLVMSGEIFAADQNTKPEESRRSGTKKATTTGTQAKTAEKLEIHVRRVSPPASSATKSDMPLIETPQSVTVITRNEMNIRNVLNLNQVVRYTAGITADLRGGIVGYYGSAPDLNVFHPNSQMAIPTPTPWVHYNTDSHQASIYGQDELHWKRLILTAAGSHIEQTNVLIAVVNTGYSAESGLVHSDGLEFEAHAEPFHNLVLTAAVSIQKVHDDSTGKPLIQSGKGNASLFAFYTMPSGPAKSLGFGGGMRYSNKSYGGEASYGSVWMPQYTVFNASVCYDLSNLFRILHGWNVGASVRNLFDKNFV